MKKIRITTIVLLITFLMTTFCGCSSTELGFYNTIKSMQKMDNYKFKGSESFVYTVAYHSPDEETENHELNVGIDYNGCFDSVNNKVSFDTVVTIKESDSISTITVPLHFLLDNSNNGSVLEITPEILDYFLYDVDLEKNEDGYYEIDLLDAIDVINNMEYPTAVINNPYDQNTQSVLYAAYVEGFNAGYSDGNNYYYNYDYVGDTDAYNDGYNQCFDNMALEEEIDSLKSAVPFIEAMTTLTKPSEEEKDVVNKISVLFDELFNDFFKDLEFDNITKTDNKYSVDVSLGDLVDVISDTTNYVLERPAALKALLLKFANSLTDSEVQTISNGNLSTVEELVQSIEEIMTPEEPTDSDVIDSGLIDEDYIDLGDAFLEELNSINEKYHPEINFTVEQTGVESFLTSNSLSLAGREEDDIITEVEDDQIEAEGNDEYYIDFSLDLSGECLIYGKTDDFEVSTPTISDDAPKAELKGESDDIREAVLTDEDEAKLASGSSISVRLNVDSINASDAEKNAIYSVLSDDAHVEFLNITLIKSVDGVESAVHNTDKPVRITVDIPESMRDANKTFVVVRVHDGVTTILTDLDEDPNTVTFETDSFSTYAISYADNTPTPGTGDSISSSLIWIFGLSLISLAALTFCAKRHLLSLKNR